MRIECSQCHATYNVPDDKVGGRAFKVTCKRCKNVIHVRPADAPSGLKTMEFSAADAELFGLLWPLADALKLDPTVDRNVFRKQRDRLKAIGYRFEPMGQQWIRN